MGSAPARRRASSTRSGAALHAWAWPTRTIQKVFAALAAGGRVTLPMKSAFWAKRWGMLVDKFGTPWTVNGEPIPV